MDLGNTNLAAAGAWSCVSWGLLAAAGCPTAGGITCGSAAGDGWPQHVPHSRILPVHTPRQTSHCRRSSTSSSSKKLAPQTAPAAAGAPAAAPKAATATAPAVLAFAPASPDTRAAIARCRCSLTTGIAATSAPSTRCLISGTPLRLAHSSCAWPAWVSTNMSTQRCLCSRPDTLPLPSTYPLQTAAGQVRGCVHPGQHAQLGVHLQGGVQRHDMLHLQLPRELQLERALHRQGHMFMLPRCVGPC